VGGIGAGPAERHGEPTGTDHTFLRSGHQTYAAIAYESQSMPTTMAR